jgi:metallo-beta-lactamase family protein
VYATHATCDIIPLELEDAYQIMSYNHRKFQYPMLYKEEDIAKLESHLRPVDYRRSFEVFPDVTATYYDAGHIFGSAFILVEGDGKRIVFSGDIGNVNAPIIQDTEPLPACDALVLESTYGNRLHPAYVSRKEALKTVLLEAIERGGTIMIPSFSVERTQELLYELNALVEEDHVLPTIPVFLDSPLAIDVTKVFEKYPQYYDEAALVRVKKGDNFLEFTGLRETYSRDESKEINFHKGQKIIIAGAGMMNGGRIQHHAMRYLPDPTSTLVLVGYQANGTVGRKIQEGNPMVHIMHEEVSVRCAVKTMTEFSGHADKNKLVGWINGAPTTPKQIFLVHGEDGAASEFLETLHTEFPAVQSSNPEFDSVVEV